MLAVAAAALAVVAFLFSAAFFLIATFFASMTSSSFLVSLIDLLIDFNFVAFFLVFHTRWVVNKIGKEGRFEDGEYRGLALLLLHDYPLPVGISIDTIIRITHSRQLNKYAVT